MFKTVKKISCLLLLAGHAVADPTPSKPWYECEQQLTDDYVGTSSIFLDGSQLPSFEGSWENWALETVTNRLELMSCPLGDRYSLKSPICHDFGASKEDHNDAAIAPQIKGILVCTVDYFYTWRFAGSFVVSKYYEMGATVTYQHAD